MTQRAKSAMPSIDGPGGAFVPWPPALETLAVLVDLGMSDAAIARYYGVGPEQVASLVVRPAIAESGRAPTL
jgi:hypothetical protein